MSFKILAGDLPENAIYAPHFNTHRIEWGFIFNRGDVTLNGNIALIEQITEENSKSFVGAAGWGLVGSIALGPVGLLAGVLSGGNSKEVTFACQLKDGRRFIARTDRTTFEILSKLADKRVTPETQYLDQMASKHQKRCTQCGTPAESDWKFCSSCAKPL